MTTPFWCLLIVVFLPFASAIAGGYHRGRAFGAADNKNPRAQATQLEGAGARAYAAQANAWEATAVFTATVFTIHAAGVAPETAAPWTIAFVVTRVLHPIFYIADLDKLRSIVFLIGMVCVVRLFVLAA